MMYASTLAKREGWTHFQSNVIKFQITLSIRIYVLKLFLKISISVTIDTPVLKLVK